jgi:hypothetical protein
VAPHDCPAHRGNIPQLGRGQVTQDPQQNLEALLSLTRGGTKIIPRKNCKILAEIFVQINVKLNFMIFTRQNVNFSKNFNIFHQTFVEIYIIQGIISITAKLSSFSVIDV